MDANRSERSTASSYLASACAALMRILLRRVPVSSFPFFAFWIVPATAGWANTIISTDQIQNGGTLAVTLSGLVITHTDNDPLLTLTDEATTSGVQAVIVGSLTGESGRLRVEDGSTLTNSGSGTLGTFGSVTVPRGWGFLGLNVGSTGVAAVTGAGSTWTNSGALNVGYFGTGILNVEDGGSVSNTSANLGIVSGSTGAVTVTGVGSTWTNSSSLNVGSSGTGILNVTNGGSVSNTTGAIGSSANSHGTVTVTGVGSTWTNSGDLNVGSSGGTGILTIENGGSVFSSGLGGRILGGTATITGAGSTWTSSSGISLSGNSNGAGTLTIENGGSLSSTTGLITSWNNSLGIGTATVTDVGSTWTNSGELYVGGSGTSSGTGVLNVKNGGSVSNTASWIGRSAGSHGTVTVTGDGSTWTNSSELRVGFEGTGVLKIENGGTVSSNLVRIEGVGSTATVTGAGSTWTISGEYGYEYGSFQVGSSGTGTLTIENGGSVSNAYSAFLGAGAGAGAVTVTGAGSTWTNGGNLILGGSSLSDSWTGTGLLTIASGGTVEVGGTLKLWNGSTLNLHAGGTLIAQTLDATLGTFNLNGGVMQVESFLTSQPEVDVTGTTWSGNTTINAPVVASSGMVNVSAGATLQAPTVSIGNNSTLVVAAGAALNTTQGITVSNGSVLLTLGVITVGQPIIVSSGGYLVVNGPVHGNVIVQAGATVIGRQHITGVVTVETGGFVSGGNSPGTLSADVLNIETGGAYLWEINSLTGQAGDAVGWDLVLGDEINVNGNAAIKLQSLTPADEQGLLAGWDASESYAWKIAQAGNDTAFTEAALALLQVDDAHFQSLGNDLAGGSFSLYSTDQTDLWLQFTPATAPSYSADFNGDGRVDGDDLIQWQGDFGPNPGSDSDGDGDSDGADFLAWQRQVGSGVPLQTANAAVPEPGTLALVAMAAVSWRRLRRRNA